MRKLLLLSAVLGLAACGGNPDVAPKVTYGYGALSDGAGYNGPAPKYSFANGLGQDMPVDTSAAPKMSYAYGADGLNNVTEQMTPAQNQQLAAPAPQPQHPAIAAPAPNSHL